MSETLIIALAQIIAPIIIEKLSKVESKDELVNDIIKLLKKHKII